MSDFDLVFFLVSIVGGFSGLCFLLSVKQRKAEQLEKDEAQAALIADKVVKLILESGRLR